MLLEVLTVLALTVAFVIHFVIFPKLAFVVAAVSMLIPVTPYGEGRDPRPFAIVAILTACLGLVTSRAKRTSSTRKLLDDPLVYLAILLGLQMLAVSILSSDVTRSLLTSTAWLATVPLLWMFGQVLGGRKFLNLITIVLSAALVASALLLLAGGEAWVGGRAVGFFTNPNGLGVTCALAFPLLALHPAKVARAASFLAVIVAVATGSRASVLAIIATTLVIVLMLRSLLALWTLLLLIVSSLAAWSSGQFDRSSALILRTNNTRSETWQGALEFARQNPWFGVGPGRLDNLGANSFLKVFAETGVMGLALALLFVAYLIASNRHSAEGAALITTGLVNAQFESWLFAGGSFYCFIFFAALVAIKIISEEKLDVDGMVLKRADSPVRRVVERDFAHRRTSSSPSGVGRPRPGLG